MHGMRYVLIAIALVIVAGVATGTTERSGSYPVERTEMLEQHKIRVKRAPVLGKIALLGGAALLGKKALLLGGATALGAGALLGAGVVGAGLYGAKHASHGYAADYRPSVTHHHHYVHPDYNGYPSHGSGWKDTSGWSNAHEYY